MSLHTITDRYRRIGTESSDDAPGATGDGVTFYAGGTDVIPLARSGVATFPVLVDLKSANGAGDAAARDRPTPSVGISRADGGWRIGALTTLADLEHDDELATAIPMIATCLRQTATLQIRNRATVGGNLLQAPRCSYYRDAAVTCWMKGGDDCPARTGRNEHHALVDGPCVATQPSDLASVLVALDAEVETSERRMPVSDFLTAPSDDHRSLHALQPGELVLAVHVPEPQSPRSTYLKAMNRAVWQFALVGLAAMVDIDDDGLVTHIRLVASGVDNVPHRLGRVEEELLGSTLDDEAVVQASGSAATGLSPLSENGYKTRLLTGLVRRAISDLTP